MGYLAGTNAVACADALLAGYCGGYRDSLSLARVNRGLLKVLDFVENK